MRSDGMWILLQTGKMNMRIIIGMHGYHEFWAYFWTMEPSNFPVLTSRWSISIFVFSVCAALSREFFGFYICFNFIVSKSKGFGIQPIVSHITGPQMDIYTKSWKSPKLAWWPVALKNSAHIFKSTQISGNLFYVHWNSIYRHF
jgi:hypothetical protein